MAGIPSPAQSPNRSPTPQAIPASPQSSYLVPLSVLTTLFLMWGGLTSLNDVLIPHLKGIFSLSYFEAMLVQFCFFGAYGLMSIPAGRFVKAIGFKKGIMVCAAQMDVGGACTDHGQCLTGNCPDGTCQPTPTGGTNPLCDG